MVREIKEGLEEVSKAWSKYTSTAGQVLEVAKVLDSPALAEKVDPELLLAAATTAGTIGSHFAEVQRAWEEYNRTRPERMWTEIERRLREAEARKGGAR